MNNYIKYFNCVFKCAEKLFDLKDYINELYKKTEETELKVKTTEPELSYDDSCDRIICKYVLNNIEYIYTAKRTNSNFNVVMKKIKELLHTDTKDIVVDDYFMMATLNDDIDITNTMNKYAGPNGIHIEENDITLKHILSEEEMDTFNFVTLTDSDCNDINCTTIDSQITSQDDAVIEL